MGDTLIMERRTDKGLEMEEFIEECEDCVSVQFGKLAGFTVEVKDSTGKVVDTYTYCGKCYSELDLG